MATRPSISHIRRGATELTTEAGKLIRDRALSAAHQALVMALQTVQAADRKLRGATTTRRKATGAIRASTKRKATRAVGKARRAVATATGRAKASRRSRRVAR